jgi:rhodanese-related sulfurtransferase
VDFDVVEESNLQLQRFTDVAALSGGIEAWSLTVDPEVPRY